MHFFRVGYNNLNFAESFWRMKAQAREWFDNYTTEVGEKKK